MREVFDTLEKEIAAIIQDGLIKGVNNHTIASNICHILGKCYEIDVETLDRNNKKWVG